MHPSSAENNPLSDYLNNPDNLKTFLSSAFQRILIFISYIINLQILLAFTNPIYICYIISFTFRVFNTQLNTGSVLQVHILILCNQLKTLLFAFISLIGFHLYVSLKQLEILSSSKDTYF